MLSLDSQRWNELDHAYGKASDIPALLRQLADLPTSEAEQEPWFSLWSALAHQGDVYSASFAAVPHVIAALAKKPVQASSVYFHFPAWVEICRRKNGVSVPADLKPAYEASLGQLPSLVAAAAAREWDAEFMACALSSIAAAKGFASVAEAALELTPQTAEDFMRWFIEQ